MGKKKRLRKQQEQQKIQQAKISNAINSWWGTRQSYYALFLILAVTFVVFIPSLDNEFVNWDDDVYVYENPFITDLSGENIKTIFTEIVGANYNPLTILTFAIEYQFVGLDPTLYHVNNLLLHLGCTALVFWLMLLLGLHPAGAIIAALLFGIHPMRVESVAWVTERKDVLFGIFYLGALVTYMYYLHSKKNRNLKYLLITGLFILSLLSKIQAVSLPLSMLAIDYLKNRPLKINLIIEKVPFFLLSLIIGLVGIYFLESRDTLVLTQKYSLFEKLLIGFYTLLVYISKFIFPYEMAAFYPYPSNAGGLPVIYYVAPFIIIALGYFIYRSTRQTRIFAFGALFFLFNVIFLLQILGAGQAFLADRFTYIAYIGFFFIIGWGADKLRTRSVSMKQTVTGVAAAYLILMAFLTFRQNEVWANSITMWSHVIDLYSDSAPDAYNNRGHYYRTLDQRDLALQDYNKAISLNQNFHLSYYNRGKIYFDKGMYQEALQDYNRTLQLKPDFAECLSNRGAVYSQLKIYDSAIVDLTKALEINPNYPEALMNRGVTYDVMGQYQNAIADYQRYLQLRPNHDVIWNNLGVAYQRINDHQNAITAFSNAIQLDPSKNFFYMNRSISYNAMGNKQMALQDALQAQQLGLQVDQGYLAGLRNG